MRKFVPYGPWGRQRVGQAGGHHRDVGGGHAVCNVSWQAPRYNVLRSFGEQSARPIDGTAVAISERG